MILMDKQERLQIMSVSGESMFARCIARIYRRRRKILAGIADLFVPAGGDASLSNRNSAFQLPKFVIY